MFLALRITRSEVKREAILLSVSLLAYLALILIFLRNYFVTDLVVWAGIISAPYILRIDRKTTGSVRFLALSAIMLAFTALTGVATFYFLSIGLAMLFILESMAGRINWTPMFLLGLLCPAFKYFNNIFGFSVRIQLSEIAGKVLNNAGYNIKVSGNVMVMENCEFAVDAGCVGLKMMGVSLLAALLMIAFFERKQERNFRFISIAGIMVLTLLMNIFSNLMRIILLVIFNILPANPAHDLVGILCLTFYVLIPIYWLIRFLSKKSRPKVGFQTTKNLVKSGIINTLLFIALVVTGFMLKEVSPSDSQTVAVTSFNGYTRSILHNDVVKLEKPECLIYIKSMNRFYGAEHNPMICWTGSGYEFQHIKKKYIHGKELFTGSLHKGTDVIYAAWWFDNGKYQTIDQMDWRWKAFKGEEFFLVNVNSDSEAVLEKEVAYLMNKKLILSAKN